jgi:HAMP domain-containing protein
MATARQYSNTTNNTNKSTKPTIGLLVGVVICALIVVALIVALVVFIRHRKIRRLASANALNQPIAPIPFAGGEKPPGTPAPLPLPPPVSGVVEMGGEPKNAAAQNKPQWTGTTPASPPPAQGQNWPTPPPVQQSPPPVYNAAEMSAPQPPQRWNGTGPDPVEMAGQHTCAPPPGPPPQLGHIVAPVYHEMDPNSHPSAR